jgi:hypothetical protein
MHPPVRTLRLPLLLLLAACSQGTEPDPVPPEVEVSLAVDRELPAYPLQPFLFTMHVEGRPAGGTLMLEGPDGRRSGAWLPHVMLHVPPQVPGTWLAQTGVMTGACNGRICIDRWNASPRVPVEVVDHSILLASDRGIPGAEAAHLQLLAAGASPSGSLLVFDGAFAKVTELPFTGGDLALPLDSFPTPGAVYYLQAATAGEATCRLQPVWVPVPKRGPAVDFGRGGFVLTAGQPKEIRFGEDGNAGTVSLGLPGALADVSVAIRGARSVTIVPVVRGDEDLVNELRVQVGTPTGVHDIRALVVVRAVR